MLFNFDEFDKYIDTSHGIWLAYRSGGDRAIALESGTSRNTTVCLVPITKSIPILCIAFELKYCFGGSGKINISTK